MNTKHDIALKHFQNVHSQERNSWPDREWHGEIDNCDVCSRPMHNELYMIDGPAQRRPNSPWGNLCIVCAFKSSPRIGWGRAQLYQKVDKIWKLVSGGPTEELE